VILLCLLKRLFCEKSEVVVRGIVQVLVGLVLLVAASTAKADVPVFGNSPNGEDGFGLVYGSPNPIFGGAVEFTPAENIEISSVSLWLIGYTGQSGQYISASIWSAGSGFPFAPYLYLNAPSPNNGSLAQFTFSNPDLGSTVLWANTAYWLVVQPGGQLGGNNQAGWVGGGNPGGDALFGRSDLYDIAPGESFEPSTVMPAFTINIVPEASYVAFLSLQLLLWVATLFTERLYLVSNLNNRSPKLHRLASAIVGNRVQ
jgi:hypothetical protein